MFTRFPAFCLHNAARALFLKTLGFNDVTKHLACENVLRRFIFSLFHS